MYKTIEAITIAVDNLPSIKLDVPFVPPFEETKKLGTWFRTNVHPRMLLTIATNSQVMEAAP